LADICVLDMQKTGFMVRRASALLPPGVWNTTGMMCTDMSVVPVAVPVVCYESFDLTTCGGLLPLGALPPVSPCNVEMGDGAWNSGSSACSSPCSFQLSGESLEGLMSPGASPPTSPRRCEQEGNIWKHGSTATEASWDSSTCDETESTGCSCISSCDDESVLEESVEDSPWTIGVKGTFIHVSSPMARIGSKQRSRSSPQRFVPSFD